MRNQEGHLLGRPRFADAETSYLLTGLLRCALCGAALGPVCPGRSAGRQAWYTCGGYHRKGPRAGCRNGLRIEVGALNAAVLDAVAKALDADTVRQAVREAVGLLSANQADIEVRRAALTAELGTLQGRERRILDSLMDAEGDVATAIKGQLRSS